MTLKPEDRKLFLRLFIPLALVASIIMFAVWVFSEDRKQDFVALLINLATDALAIIVTIWYVNQVLAKRESDIWKPTSALVDSRISRLISKLISSVFVSLGLKKDLLSKLVAGESLMDYKKRVYERSIQLIPQIELQLTTLDLDSRKNLVSFLEEGVKSIADIINLFGTRLTPEQMELCLRIEDRLNHVIGGFTFVDLFDERGRPDSQGDAISIIARQLETMIRELIQLNQTIHPVFSHVEKIPPP